MKSQRRHDLKQNVLSIELAHIRDFLKRRGNLLAWAALIIALIVLVVVYVNKRNRDAVENVRVKFEQLQILAQNPEAKAEDILTGYKELAEQNDDLFLAASASVTVADQYLMRSIVGQSPEQGELAGKPLAKSEQKELQDQAGQWYRRTIQNFPRQPAAVARAHIGLAKLAESRGEFDQAASSYDAAIALGVAGITDLAQQGKDRLSKLKAPVPMATTAPAPPTPPAPATLPATAPATTGPAPATLPATAPAAPRAPATAPAAPKTEAKTTQPAKTEAPKTAATGPAGEGK